MSVLVALSTSVAAMVPVSATTGSAAAASACREAVVSAPAPSVRPMLASEPENTGASLAGVMVMLTARPAAETPPTVTSANTSVPVLKPPAYTLSAA